MKAKNYILTIIIALALTNCKSVITTEEKIISDIFPQLVDSLRFSTKNLWPAPPPPKYDKNSNFIGIDSIKAEKIIKEHKRKLQIIDSIDSRIIMVVYDTCFTININDLENRTFKDSSLLRRLVIRSDSNQIKKKKLDLNKIITDQKFVLVEKSTIEKKYRDALKIRDRRSGGLLRFSRAYIDNDIGLIEIEAIPFYDGGAGYYLIIERYNNKWRIKKIILNWIA